MTNLISTEPVQSNYFSAYPTIGHSLTTKDIGQLIVRVDAFKNGDRLDLSYLPTLAHRERVRLKAVVLKEIKEDGTLVCSHMNLPSILPKEWNDGNWIRANLYFKRITSDNLVLREFPKTKVQHIPFGTGKLELPKRSVPFSFVRHY